MSRITAFAFALAAVASSPAIVAQTAPARLEVRYAPDDYAYLAQENRNFALASVELHNVAIVNTGESPVTVDEVMIEILVKDAVFRSERLAGELLARRWARLKGYLDLPGVYASEDARFRFKELLGEHPKLSSSTTLEPGSAIYVARRFFFVDAMVETVEGKPKPTFPDRIRVSVLGTAASGERVSATREIRIVLYEPPNEYVFPLQGRWYVASSSSVRSHHRSQPVHEFALDLVQVGEGGSSFRGKGTVHGDYYAFGKDVLAIADGVVVAASGDLPDSRLRRPDESPEDYRRSVMEPLAARGPQATGGNQVVIEHADQEFSSYAHLKAGSIRVKKGDRVRRGQPIAQVGLSGDGYQPHLHIQLTDGPDGSYAHAKPLIFTNVRPVLFSSTLDTEGRRQLQTGEFVETTP